MACDHGRGENLVFLLVGGLIGAGIALLYAPKAGRETREDIRRLASRGAEAMMAEKEAIQQRLSSLIHQISNKTEELVHGGAQMAEDKKREILAAIQAAKRAYDEERRKLEEERTPH